MPVPQRLALACLLAAASCGGNAPAPETPDNTADEDAAVAPPKKDAAPAPDVAGTPERHDAAATAPDTAPAPDTARESDTAVDSAVPDMAPVLGEFPLAAVKAAKAERVAAVGTHVEGPSWRDGDVFFASDGNGLLRLDAEGKLYRYHPTLNPVGTYALADGSILICEKKHIVVQMFRDGKIGVVLGEGAGAGFCNDLTVDADGNIYFTDAHAGNILRITPEGDVSKVVTGRNYPNGVEVDPQSKYLYFSTGGNVFRQPLKGGGAEQVVGVGADGMAFDLWGNLWMANVGAGQAVVFDPVKKQTLANVPAGGGPFTNLTFGGPERDTIYTTVSGKGIWRARVGARGFLHPGAPKYALKRMLDITPANTPFK